MGEVLYLNMISRNDLLPDQVLDAAKDFGLTQVVVMGYDAAGSEYMASSAADGGVGMWLIERCKHRLLEVASEMETTDG